MYLSYIWPILTYGSAIFSPNKQDLPVFLLFQLYDVLLLNKIIDGELGSELQTHPQIVNKNLFDMIQSLYNYNVFREEYTIKSNK